MRYYALTQSVAPSVEPVTRDEAKAHLRVDSTAEDVYIDGLIVAAREMAEAYTQRQLITATYVMKMHDFPDGDGVICIPRSPLGSVSSIAYIDAGGSTQTLSTDIYEVFSNDTHAYVALKPARVWPSARFEQREAVSVTFTAGYGASGASVPAAIRSAMFLIIGNLFENREQSVHGSINEMPMGVRTLLNTAKVKDVV